MENKIKAMLGKILICFHVFLLPAWYMKCNKIRLNTTQKKEEMLV